MSTGPSGFSGVILLGFFLMLAWGFALGSQAAGADRVERGELEGALADPIEQVPEEKYTQFHNETEENVTAATIDEYEALMLIPDGGDGVGADASSNFLESSIRTVMFPAYLSAPWGYEYPEWGRTAAHVSIIAWVGQIAYMIHRWRKGLQRGGSA